MQKHFFPKILHASQQTVGFVLETEKKCCRPAAYSVKKKKIRLHPAVRFCLATSQVMSSLTEQQESIVWHQEPSPDVLQQLYHQWTLSSSSLIVRPWLTTWSSKVTWISSIHSELLSQSSSSHSSHTTSEYWVHNSIFSRYYWNIFITKQVQHLFSYSSST